MPRSRNRRKNNKSNKVMSNQHKPVKQGGQAPTHVSVQHQAHFKADIFHSNYPPPEMLNSYSQIDQSFPERLIAMAETEGNHRRQMEKSAFRWAVILDMVSTVLAFGGVLAILFVGYLFMKNTNANEGAWIIGTVTVALAIAFLTRGRKKAKK